jgi:hypothetical protein
MLIVVCFFSGLSLKKKPFCQLSWRSQNRIALTFGRSALVYSAEEPCNVTNRCAFLDTLDSFPSLVMCVGGCCIFLRMRSLTYKTL